MPFRGGLAAHAPSEIHVPRLLSEPRRRQMVQSLRRYYPDELEVLKIIASGDKEFARSLLRDDASILNHLVGYGVVDSTSLRG